MSGLGKWPLDTGLSVVFISLSRIITTTQAVRTSLTFLQKWPFFARGDKVVLYKNGTDSLHVFVLLKNGDFFLRFGLPSTRIHWKRSPKAYLLEREKFWKRRFAVLMWMGQNKGFVKTITCTSRCWIPVNVHAPIKDCTEPFFIHCCVFVWTSENDKKKKRNVWTRSFGRRKKVSVFKQIRTIIRILYIQTNGKKTV